jgi:dolichol-phosphate mannosyltransferase
LIESRHETDRPEFSIVIPVYNEEESLPELVRRLGLLIEQLDGPAEVILVDDGSSDRSYEAMVAAHEADSRFKVVRLSRNFGHEMATTAGVDFAAGNAVIIMDADLQDPTSSTASARTVLGKPESRGRPQEPSTGCCAA